MTSVASGASNRPVLGKFDSYACTKKTLGCTLYVKFKLFVECSHKFQDDILKPNLHRASTAQKYWSVALYASLSKIFTEKMRRDPLNFTVIWSASEWGTASAASSRERRVAA